EFCLVLFRSAVRHFHSLVGHLTITGQVDTETWAALLAAGQSLLDALLQDDGDPLTWDELPLGLVEEALALSRACVEHGVVYGPGRAHFNPERKLWIVTQGAFGLGSGRYKTRRRGPAFVCSSWTYFVLMYLLRRYIEFNANKAGAQPPLGTVLSSKPGTHRWQRSGPWWGLAPYVQRVTGDGSTQERNDRARKGFIDLQEAWTRMEADPLSWPELSVWEWASARRGFVHHTALVISDRSTRRLHFIDAGGWKDASGTFSGTYMDIQTISTIGEAIEAGRSGWGRAWGVVAAPELHMAHARPMPGLAFETGHKQIEVAWEAH
ncbi:MAG: hypothetical protein AAFX99_22495, partial [Myxococcota bacterium]